MLNLPTSVLDYVYTLTIENRSPAYLLVGKDGRLSDWGGKLAAYGITGLQKGKPIGEQVFFLEGLFPLDESPISLSCVKTEAGLSADIHIIPGDEGDWVLLLDASSEEIHRVLLQQMRNELSLLRDMQPRILDRQLRKDIAEKSGQGETMNEPILSDLFTVLLLDTIILERLDDGSFRVIGTVPDWFMQLYPEAAFEQEGLKPEKRFPFLENFLIDAEDFWREKSAGWLKSGPWTETDQSENEYHLEAAAICLGSRKIILIELPKIAYEEKHSLIQKARENKLKYSRLVKEIQKKEILIHCIVHDLRNPLVGIINYLSLLAKENLPPTGRNFLEIAIEQSNKLEMLTQEILDVFSAEVESLEAFRLDPTQAPDAAICVKDVVEAFLPAFSPNKVELQLDPNINMREDWKVFGEKSRLERIISNLLENALRYSPSGSVVTVGVKDDGEFVLITVDDEGPGVPQEVSEKLFQKFSQRKEKPGKAGLGLYFCRITVERWGGTIGYLPRPEGGSRFWFRLPRPASR